MLDQTEAQKLLDHLCVKLGFCLPSEKQQTIVESAYKDVKSFTDAVFIAEGVNPETADKHLYRQVKGEVQEAFHRAEDSQHR